MSPALARIRPTVPHVAEAALVVGLYLLYNAARPFVEGTESIAVDHAFHIIALERAAGVFHEEQLQRIAYEHRWFGAAMEWTYLHAYHPLLVIGAALVYVRDRALYVRYRNVLFLSMAAGLIIFATFPVAPPRLLPEFGFVDDMRPAGELTSAIKNDYAAVPSYHFGFVLLAAVAVAQAYRPRVWIAAALMLIPGIMLISIVATANHFFFDAAAGAVIVLAASWLLVWRAPAGGAARRHAPSPA